MLQPTRGAHNWRQCEIYFLRTWSLDKILSSSLREKNVYDYYEGKVKHCGQLMQGKEVLGKSLKEGICWWKDNLLCCWSVKRQLAFHQYVSKSSLGSQQNFGFY